MRGDYRESPADATHGTPVSRASHGYNGLIIFMLKRRELKLEQMLALAESGYVFAIVDACSNSKAVVNKAQELGQRAISLFQGTRFEEYWAVAPYLFAVDRALLEWLDGTLRQPDWGILVFSKATCDELCKHLQCFFNVVLPNGYRYFFRYYDPRVLEPYLAGSQPAQLQSFFGPIRGFGLFGEEQKIWVYEIGSASQQSPGSPLQTGSLRHIRPEQFQALTEAARSSFAAKIITHVKQFFPEHVQAVGADGTTQLVQYGIAKAAHYGISAEPDLFRVMKLVFRIM
jgi:hypothetical protein